MEACGLSGWYVLPLGCCLASVGGVIGENLCLQ